jgi:hypothetical protein
MGYKDGAFTSTWVNWSRIPLIDAEFDFFFLWFLRINRKYPSKTEEIR